MMINCCKNIIDWNAVSAISNIVLAVIAVLSLIFNFWVIYNSNRPRLQFSIVKIEQAFYLKVKNVGARMAKDIRLKVTGEPISNSLYNTIKKAFDYLAENPFYLEAGGEKYFCLCPDKIDTSKKSDWKKWLNNNNVTIEQISDWADKYHDKKIIIHVRYNCCHCESNSFSIKGYISLAAYGVKSPIQQIAETLRDIKNDFENKNN